MATAEKERAIDLAEAEKAYRIGLLEEQFDDSDVQEAAHEHAVDVAQADVVYVTAMEGAKHAFQQTESTSRQTYSQAVAGAEYNRLTGASGLNQLAHDAAVAEAGYQAAVDATFAETEEDYWTAETVAENDHRTAVAAADVNYWSNEESSRASAAQSLHSALNSPWSEFLVASATAHADWWSDTVDDYIQWIANRNAKETQWQTDINTARVPLSPR